MALLTSLPELSQAVMDKIEAAQEDLKIHSVFYGDQSKLPGTPVVCIEPGTKSVELRNAYRVVDIEFVIYVLIYSGLVTSAATNRKEADTLAEAIETILNADPQLLLAGEGRLIHCYVSDVESGYSQKENGPVRSSRLTFRAKSQDKLPSSG